MQRNKERDYWIYDTFEEAIYRTFEKVQKSEPKKKQHKLNVCQHPFDGYKMKGTINLLKRPGENASCVVIAATFR